MAKSPLFQTFQIRPASVAELPISLGEVTEEMGSEQMPVLKDFDPSDQNKGLLAEPPLARKSWLVWMNALLLARSVGC